MSIFDLLGAAGAGYAQGAVKGEQAKINYKQQLQENNFKQQTIDLQKLKLLQDAKSATTDANGRLTELGIKAATEALHSYSDPQFRADHDAQAKAAGLENSTQVSAKLVKYIQAAMSGKDPGEFPYPQALQKVIDAESAKQTQPQSSEAPAPNLPAPSNTSQDYQGPSREDFLRQVLPHIPGMGGAVNLFPQPAAPQDGSTAEQTTQPTAPSLVPTAAPSPNFVPQPEATAAKIEADKQKALGSVATARYNTARATNEEARAPYVVPGEVAGIKNKNADTGLKNQQNKVLGGRLALDQKKADDFNKHWDDTYAASRTDANRDYALHARMTDVAQYAAETRDALAKAEMGLMQIRGKELQQKITDMERLDPYFRGLIQALPAMVQTDLYGDKAISPEVAGMLRGALETAQSKYSQILGQYSGGSQPNVSQPGATPSFVPQQQGNVPMLPNQQTGMVTPPAAPTVVIPHGVKLNGPGGGNSVWGNQGIINAEPGPRTARKGKTNTRQPAKATPKAQQSSKPRAVKSLSTEELQRELFSGKKGK